jgi:hypothetical protein
MDKHIAQGIQKGFRWLASLNPLEPSLFASVSIGKNSGSFSEENWNNLEPFAAEFSPDRNAVIIIQRTEKDGSQTLVGMLCRDGEWMQAPANLLLEVNQISPELEKRAPTPNLRCADITSIYPDCPATVLGKNDPQEDVEEEEYDHNPVFDPIPEGAVKSSPSTAAKIAEAGRVAAEIDDLFQWLSTLDAAKDDLHCTIYTGLTEQNYSKENWDAISSADCSATSAKAVLAKIETSPDGAEKTTIIGLAHYGKKWEALSQEEIKKLAKSQPEAFDWIDRMQNPTFANIKDIYPSCPI